MLFASVLLSAVSAASAIQITYFTDDHCETVAYTEELDYEVCTKFTNAQHPAVRSAKADTTEIIFSSFFNHENCTGTTSRHQFSEGKCVVVQDYSTFQLETPEQTDVQLYYYPATADCSGEPTTLTAKESTQTFSDDQCTGNGSVRVAESRGKEGLIVMSGPVCGIKECGHGKVLDLNDASCVPLKETYNFGSVGALQEYKLYMPN